MNNLKSGLIALTFTLIATVNAQEKTESKNFCGTEVPVAAWEERFQELIRERKQAGASNKTQQVTYVIPVIIHVLHGGQSVGNFPNLAQGQLISQIEALNNDFAGTGYNSGNYPLTAFNNWGPLNAPASLDALGRIMMANCGVEFCLAKKDTLGNVLAEPGIDRINYVSRGWSNPAGFTTNASFKTFMDGTVKPNTIWNVSRYLNIWVSDVNLPAFGLLGYATFPTLSGLGGTVPSGGNSQKDGFWAYAAAFGSASTYPSGVYSPGYNRGRTGTHEIGHWLGLRHIWGDCAASPCCEAGIQINFKDYCNDTPPATFSNFNSPSYPLKTNGCVTSSPDGEMFMNFMDYTDDPIKYMFTPDQAERVQTAMANSPYRKFLGTHNLCTVEHIGASALFTNANTVCTGANVKLANQTVGYPAPSYTWASPGAMFTPNANAISPTVSFPTPGTYVVTLTADNGTVSVVSKTITATSPALMLSSVSQTVCEGSVVTLNADGLDTFTWQPGNKVGFSVTYTLTQSQVFTCNASLANGCTSTNTLSMFVTACTGFKQLGLLPTAFNIYPNPAKDILHITSYNEKNTESAVEIIDALGKTVVSQHVLFTKEKSNQQITVSQLPNGVYFVKIKSPGTAVQVIKLVKE